MLASNLVRFLTLILFLNCTILVSGQIKSKDTILVLNEVLILKPTPPISPTKYSIVKISRAELRQFNGLNIAPVINQVPGVYLQQAALNTNRVVVRGVGSRTPFSSNRIKAYINDIPISSSDGETVIEDLDLNLFDQVSLHKSPKTQFGGTLGGTFIFETPDSFSNSFSHIQTAGNFGLLSSSSGFSFHQNNSSFAVSYNQLEKEGYRENSKYRRDGINVMGVQRIGSRNTLNYFIQYIDLKAFIPSSLNENDFQNSPEKAAFTWGNAEGFESYFKTIGGISLRTEWNDKIYSSISLFGQFKNGYEPRPFNILDEDYNRLGTRIQFNWQHNFYKGKALLSVGSELLFEDIEIRTFENLYQDFPNQGSIQGNELNTRSHTIQSFNYFIQESIQWNKKLSGSIGLVVNHSNYSLDSQTSIPAQENSIPSSISPQIEINYERNDNVQLYGIWSYGYSNPSFSNTIDSDGNVNTELNPEKGRNIEVGSQVSILEQQLRIKLAIYQLNLNDLITNKPTGDNQFTIVNSGEIQNRGIEFNLGVNKSISKKFENSTILNGSFNFYQFNDFQESGSHFGGNQLTGTPDRTIWFTNTLSFNKQISFSIQVQHVGGIPLNDENTLFSEAYSLIHAQLSYQKALSKKLKIEFKTGINNLFNTTYAASILPNAVGFGNNLPRYYYPGDALNYWGQLSIQYQFK